MRAHLNAGLASRRRRCFIFSVTETMADEWDSGHDASRQAREKPGHAAEEKAAWNFRTSGTSGV
jgi:hypothetical protein